MTTSFVNQQIRQAGSKLWLITGASRGIGLEMVKQLLASGQTVIGACRNPDGARDLWEIQRDYKTTFSFIKLDVADASSVKEFANEMKGKAIDVLVNNAGVLNGADESFKDLNFDDVMKCLTVNTVGPMRVVQALLDNLAQTKHAKVINISSMMGSIADNTSGGYYGYRMSKAALNMFNKSLTKDFPQLTSVVMHPGWVKTDMGGEKAPTERDDSVSGLLKVIHDLKPSDSGKFYSFQGKELSW